jgi:hypothetical protein
MLDPDAPGAREAAGKAEGVFREVGESVLIRDLLPIIGEAGEGAGAESTEGAAAV